MTGETVLIIEDRRENIVHLANNVLKPNGYQVMTAMDGQRGLKRALTEDPDLIIMDLRMPKMDGLEVLTALRERHVTTPVILTTFYGSEQVAEQALRLGAAGYVVKPFDVDEMLEVVERALAQRTLSPPPAEPGPDLDEPMPLTRQMERWMRDMNILTRIGKALVAQLDMDRVCARAVEATIYITRSDQAFLCLGGGTEDANLRLRASRGPEDRHVRYVDMPVEQGFVLQVARTGKAMIQAEGGEDPFLADASREPIGPVAAVPIRWQAKTSGVLVAARRPGEFPFGEGDLEWLGELAEYAAIAIRNADTLQHCKEQAQAREREADRAALVRKELDDLAALLQAGAETAGELANRLSLDPSAPREPAALDGTPDRSGLPTEPTRPS